VGFLQTTLDRGPLQIATGTGYLLLRRVGDLVNLEFRGLDDVGITKVAVRTEDVRTRLREVAENSPALSAVG
jgi:hypothetical protein